MTNKSKKQPDHLFRGLVVSLSTRRKLQFFGLIGLMLVGSMAELATLGALLPFITLMAEPERAFEFSYLRNLFEFFGWGDPNSLLLPMTILFSLVILTAMCVRLILGWCSNRFVYGLGYDIGVTLYDRVLHQPYEFHIGNHSSAVVAAITKVQLVVNRVLKPLMEAVISTILAISIISALLFINAQVAMIAASTLGVAYFLISRTVQTQLRRNSVKISAGQTDRVQAIQEGIGGIRDVLLDNSQSYFLHEFGNVDQRLRNAQAANSLMGMLPRYVIEGLGMLLLVIFAFNVASGPEGLVPFLPTLGAIGLGAQRLLPMLQSVYNSWSNVVGYRQIFVDVLHYLQLPDYSHNSKKENAKDGICFKRDGSGIELKKISFRYNDDGPWVLKEIDLQIPWGSRVGIIGQTGSGKSTLMDIILGLLRPQRGELLIEEVALSPRNSKSWQKRIAHVPQSIFLGDATIAENIAFGIPQNQIDIDRVRNAAKQAQLGDFIESLPLGYYHRVGERGIQLSGGQRQRLGIARALYKQADVLVFDEATSALDNETEAALMDCIEGLRDDLTIIMIAHRLTTLRSCDKLIRLVQGRIETVGAFQEMIGDLRLTGEDKKS